MHTSHAVTMLTLVLVCIQCASTPHIVCVTHFIQYDRHSLIGVFWCSLHTFISVIPCRHCREFLFLFLMTNNDTKNKITHTQRIKMKQLIAVMKCFTVIVAFSIG